MKLNGNSITSIFKYEVGITYELDDIILHEGDLYHVKEEFISSDSSELTSSIYCEPYFEYISNVNTSNAPLTKSGFKNLFKQYVKGITESGLESITANSVTDLNKLTDTAVYKLELLRNAQGGILPKGSYIFRSYKLSEGKVIQELINIDTGFIAIRNYVDGGSSNLFITTPNNENQNFVDQLITQLDRYESLYSKIQKEARILMDYEIEVNDEGEGNLFSIKTESTPYLKIFLDDSVYNTKSMMVLDVDTSLGVKEYTLGYGTKLVVEPQIQLNTIRFKFINNVTYKLNRIIGTRNLWQSYSQS